MADRRYNPKTLQRLCCRAICKRSDLYAPHAFDDLNRPCLKLLAFSFSLHDVLIFESYLKDRGIDTKLVLNTLQHLYLKNEPAFPMPSNDLPHALSFTGKAGWESALNHLLLKQLFNPVLEEYAAVVRKGEDSSDYLRETIYKYPSLQKLFVPRHKLKRFKEVSRPQARQFQNITHHTIINFCSVAALKMVFMVLDANAYDFIGDSAHSHIFLSICRAVKSISLLVKSDRLVIYIIDVLRANGVFLDRINLYCLKEIDMEFFDEALSKISGVSGYYDSNIANKKQIDMEVEPVKTLCIEDEDMPEEPMSQENAGNELESEDDLMDDAILAGLQPLPAQDDSSDGVPKFVFKTTNLVRSYLYNSVLDHHFKHWLSLTHLDLQAPVIERRLGFSLCVLIKRMTFKSLTLSHGEIYHSVLDDLFSCIASFRGQAPLEELFLVSLHEHVDIMQEQLINPQVEADLMEYFYHFKSHRLFQFGIFRGTKAFEMSGSRFSFKTDCLVRQFLLGDGAIKKLYLSGHLNRLVLKSILRGLATHVRPVTHFIMEEYCLHTQEDSSALNCYLESISKTLTTLTLRGAFCFRDRQSFIASSTAVANCEFLKSLDLGKNVALIKNAVSFMDVFVKGPNKELRELSLRSNSISRSDIVRILKLLIKQTCCRPTLDILDVRGNGFINTDLESSKYKDIKSKAARRMICDEAIPIM